MTMSADTVLRVGEIAREVAKMAADLLVDEREQAKLDKQWRDHYNATGKAIYVAAVPRLAVKRAALKRRSLDLTRALADMRRR